MHKALASILLPSFLLYHNVPIACGHLVLSARLPPAAAPLFLLMLHPRVLYLFLHIIWSQPATCRIAAAPVRRPRRSRGQAQRHGWRPWWQAFRHRVRQSLQLAPLAQEAHAVCFTLSAVLEEPPCLPSPVWLLQACSKRLARFVRAAWRMHSRLQHSALKSSTFLHNPNRFPSCRPARDV